MVIQFSLLTSNKILADLLERMIAHNDQIPLSA